MDSRRSRPGVKRPDRLPHHISSIAHHFLPSSDEEKSGTARTIARICVASPSGCRASAFSTAGLLAGFSSPDPAGGATEARGLVTPDLFLHEAKASNWSACAYLDPQHCHSFQETRSRGLRPPGAGCTWKISQIVEDTGQAGSSLGGQVDVHHLGTIGDPFLEWAESRYAVGTSNGEPDTIQTGLVWCIERRHVGSLATALVLGRLLAALGIGRLEILIFPDPEEGSGRRGWAHRIQGLAWRGKQPALADHGEILELVTCLRPDLPVQVTQLEQPEDGRLAQGWFASLREAAGRLLHSTNST